MREEPRRGTRAAPAQVGASATCAVTVASGPRSSQEPAASSTGSAVRPMMARLRARMMRAKIPWLVISRSKLAGFSRTVNGLRLLPRNRSSAKILSDFLLCKEFLYAPARKKQNKAQNTLSTLFLTGAVILIRRFPAIPFLQNRTCIHLQPGTLSHTSGLCVLSKFRKNSQSRIGQSKMTGYG